MKFPDHLYDIFKYLAQVGLPALATLVFSLGPIWDLPNADEITKTIVAVNVFLGALLVLNQVRWNHSDEKYDGTIDPYYANGVTSPAALHLENEDKAQEKRDILLKVQSSEDVPPTVARE
jgi:hypothetical protein